MDDNSSTTFDPADMFTRLWGDFATRMTQASSGFDPQNITPDATRKMRDSFINALNQHAQQFMRSPEFLAMLKQQLDAGIGVRKQLNDLFGQIQHEFQSASRQDADQLMETLQHLETRVASGLDRLGQHIDRLNTRLERLERNGLSAQPKAANASAKPAAGARNSKPLRAKKASR